MALLDVIDVAANQLRVGYNGSNYADFSVGSTGDLTITPTGADVIIGTARLMVGTTVTTGAAAGDVVLANAKALRSVDAAGTGTNPLISAAAAHDSLVILGSRGLPNVVIGYKSATSLPPAGAGATWDGTVVIDTTNNRLVYYVNGSRFYLTGTSF